MSYKLWFWFIVMLLGWAVVFALDRIINEWWGYLPLACYVGALVGYIFSRMEEE